VRREGRERVRTGTKVATIVFRVQFSSDLLGYRAVATVGGERY
jgi:hypothetical protein